MSFSPNGSYLASGGIDGKVIIWDLSDKTAKWRFVYFTSRAKLRFNVNCIVVRQADTKLNLLLRLNSTRRRTR